MKEERILLALLVAAMAGLLLFGCVTAEKEEDETLKSLKEAFEKLQWDYLENTYNKTVKLVKNLRYSAKDVRKFSIALAEFQDEENFERRAGIFLSALINTCEDKEFTIITEHLEKPIDLLGHKNTKYITVKGDTRYWVGSWMEGGTITVEGNAGDGVGWEMKDGTITVEGNAGYRVGDSMEGGTITVEGNAGDGVGGGMKGGTVTVKGNAGEFVGWEMKGGIITVKGNAGEFVGYEMKGGTIYLEGDFGSLYKDIRGGNIYHKGTLIVKDGKLQ